MAVHHWICLLCLTCPALALRLQDNGSQSQLTLNDAECSLGVTLLTSTFVPGSINQEVFLPGNDTDRFQEILAAIGENLANPCITEMHLLIENSASTTCANTRKLIAIFNREAGMEKLWCIDIHAEPMYKDLFDYANKKLAGKTVALANADTVFDASLDMLDDAAFRQQGIGYVLSVIPPPPKGQYKRRTGAECKAQFSMPETKAKHNFGMTNGPRCVLGAWDGGMWGKKAAGDSWDAFIFASPLPATVNTSRLNFKTHLLGAENRVLYELAVNGNMKWYNPCKYIRLYHWHCKTSKSHGDWSQDSKLLPRANISLFNMYPCWNCPGLKLDQKTMTGLCTYGTKRPLSLGQSRSFKYPNNVEICCKSSSTDKCHALDVGQLGLCESPADKNCLMWHWGYEPTIK